MTSTDREFGFTTIPRALLSAAAGIAFSVERAVVGDARVRTARRNAWEAVCADRAAARRRAELDALLATLAHVPAGPVGPVGPAGPVVGVVGSAEPVVGSSPRSRASQASLAGSARA
ncbi:hypothetical protein J3R04_002988 [Spirilliplanes yamanashiensis]|nr:hypothetical protein [Spirilliplanes yamanashiensis]